MEKTELLEIFDREVRQQSNFPGTQREVLSKVIRVIIPGEQSGFIPYSALDEAGADAEIAAQLAYFKARGIGFEWKVYDHDRPADLRQRLQTRGFVIEEPEALLVLDLQDAPEFYWTMDTSCVVHLTDPAELDEIMRLEDEIWGGSHAWIKTRLGQDMVRHPDLIAVFMVPVDGRVVSAAWMYAEPPSSFTGLYGGSTLPAYRHRGYYTALLAARARVARERGSRYLMVDASPHSKPILEKHGFQLLGYSTPCRWEPEPREEAHA